MPGHYHNIEIETREKTDLDALIDERVRYTVQYAAENSPFYRRWFREHGILPEEIREHEDLLSLPIISGETIRQNQPPSTPEYDFRSVSWDDVFTLHETSGTSGVPKTFFFTWQDWERYAEKYARAFTAQGFSTGDRVVICASYGMNIGANTMTLAARDIGITIIPAGKCTFPVRVITSYHPSAIVGSVFKLLRLAGRLKAEGIDPQECGVSRLVVGGESFAEESRAYVAEIWGCPVYNTYGSTEGAMCGECEQQAGLHVPEDLVHVDLYDPGMQRFVSDGERGRLVYTTLLPVGGKTGTLLINYDTEDTTIVCSRDRCGCGRTHMRIENPQREAETFRIGGVPFNRVDVERAVFQRENMEDLTGEYEAFIYGDEDSVETTLRVSMESFHPEGCDQPGIEERFRESLYQHVPRLGQAETDGSFNLVFHYAPPGGLELHRVKGRPKRIVDRR